MKRSLKPPMEPQRKPSTLHYQTFPTKPPTSRGRPLSSSPAPPGASCGNGSDTSDSNNESPLPKKQLAILAVIALAEQTALNSISPYLPEMASTFPDVQERQVGLYVGAIASSFALAQFVTNFFWGWLSDKIGRKPVVLTGTVLTAACFLAFGFCKSLWQAILVQVFMGLVNGNQGVVSTCLGEITDRSNQSRAFTYLPVVYGIGGITGPVVGGLLVRRKSASKDDGSNPYPYLAPNLFAVAILLVDLAMTIAFLEESLEEAKELPPLGERIENLFAWIWEFASGSRHPTYLRRLTGRRSYQKNRRHEANEDEDPGDDDSSSSTPAFFPTATERMARKTVFNRDTILLLGTFLVFQLANISFNSLYPIFAQASPPTGRDLSPREIGLSMAFAGVVTILFQIGVYGKLRDKMGNKTTYRVSLATFVVAFLLMPWVGYKDSSGLGRGRGNAVLWIELGFVLIIKTVAAVGGLTSALLLITNSAPNNSVLGTLNGLAQTLSAAGRAAGPFMSGSLFSAATHVSPKGEALAFGVFGGITFIGFLLSFGIRGQALEAEGWDEEATRSDETDGCNDDDTDSDERSGLLRRRS